MSPWRDVLVEHCFLDPDVVELVRKQWRASAVAWVADRYGNTAPLLELPSRFGRRLVSPYEAGIALGDKATGEVPGNKLLRPLAERLLEELGGGRGGSLQLRVPLEFVEAHGHGILEPFLLAGFDVTLPLWERSIDLALSPEDIVRHADERVRRRLRQGAAAALPVEFHHGASVPPAVLEDLYAAATRTREAGGSRMKHDRRLYLEDRAALIEQGKAVLAVCAHRGFRGYLLALASRGVGYYWDGAWTGEKSAFANHHLHYRTMLYLRDLGVRRYSLGYVFPDLRQGEASKGGSIAFFKDGFGDALRPVYVVGVTRERHTARLARRVWHGPLGAAARRVLGRRGA